MKQTILIFMILFSLNSSAADRKPGATVPRETFERLKKLYPEQSESFIIDRYHAADSAFQKWRSFPPYFYDLLKRSQKELGSEFTERLGMCAGDPHLENFGFVFYKKSEFVLNDLDDASICPLNADALRLFIGHRLVFPALNVQEWVHEYKSGLTGLKKPMPPFLESLEKESLKHNSNMSKKYKKLLDKGVPCEGELVSLTPEDEEMIRLFFATEGNTFHKGCVRLKNTGGSAGLRRYIIYYKTLSGIEAIELKPLQTPSPLFDQSVSQSSRMEMIRQAVTIFFGRDYEKVYYPILIKGQLFFRRPLWAGNVDFGVNDLNSSDLKDIVLYEAHTLGKYHRATDKGLKFSYSPEKWESIAREIEKKWRFEFAE